MFYNKKEQERAEYKTLGGVGEFLRWINKEIQVSVVPMS